MLDTLFTRDEWDNLPSPTQKVLHDAHNCYEDDLLYAIHFGSAINLIDLGASGATLLMLVKAVKIDQS